MSKEFTKEDVIQNKKEAIRKLNKMLELFINNPSNKRLKKANLISYWIKSFSEYVKWEDNFSSSKLIRYSRGDIIRANFGFNIGKEFGGLHFAVVIDNDNKRNADVVTVIPLSSTDGKKVHDRSVDLGKELFEKINAKQRILLENAAEELLELQKMSESLNSALEIIRTMNADSIKSNPEISDKQLKAEENYKQVIQKQEHLKQDVCNLQRNQTEISRLKQGSMALTNQITTISKQRIYTPKKSEDFLYGISLSEPAMDKINSKLKELFIFH